MADGLGGPPGEVVAERSDEVAASRHGWGDPDELAILAVAGSLQARSSNAALVRAAQRVVPDGLRLIVHPSLADVPLLNPELDPEGGEAPAPVTALRAAFAAADGVLIATPEYGHSLPGLLKNALDWLVGSGELSRMPVALIGLPVVTEQERTLRRQAGRPAPMCIRRESAAAALLANLRSLSVAGDRPCLRVPHGYFTGENRDYGISI